MVIDFRVEINALAFDTDPEIDAWPGLIIESHVPFADEGGFITGVVQQAREGDQLMAESVPRCIVADAMFVGVLPGEKTGATGRTERGGHESIEESGPFASDPLDMRNFDERIIDFIPAQVVDEDEDNVGALAGSGLTCDRESYQRQKKGKMTHRG